MNTIDVHVHAVPRPLLDEMAGGLHGFAAHQVDGVWHVRAPGYGQLRPAGPRMTSTSARADWMAEAGIDSQVLSPWMDVVTVEMKLDEERGWLRRLNDAMLGEAAAAGKNARTLAAVSLVNGDRAADDLVESVRQGAAGGYLTTSPADGRMLSDAGFRPLWAAAAEHRIPIMLHPPTVGPSNALGSLRAFGNVYGRLIDNTVAVADLILAGVLDEYPGLRILLVHGGGFLTYQASRLDGGYRTGESRQVELARERPSAYLSAFRYDTVAMSSGAIRSLVEEVGADHVALGTDFPFPIGDPAPLRTLAASGLSEVERTTICSGTGADLFFH